MPLNQTSKRRAKVEFRHLLQRVQRLTPLAKTDLNRGSITWTGRAAANQVLHGCQWSTNSFDGVDGSYPFAGLLQATSGTLYGTTAFGGVGSCPYGGGTVFTFSSGIGPFVQPVTYLATVGATIEFLGQGFNSKTTVSFNGTPATRRVISSTYLTATVPRGDTTGFVTITTSGTTLQSNKIFNVIP